MKDQLRAILQGFETLKFTLIIKKKRMLKNYFSCLAGGYKIASDNYLQFNLKPQRADQLTICNRFGIGQASRAIVIQGPLVTEDDYTLETVRLYKRTCPGATIVVSTWEGACAETCSLIEAEGAHIVLSPPPEYSGVGNVNFQVVSTLAGLDLASKLGCKRALKCRSDQRLARVNLISYFDGLLGLFPVDDSEFELGQRERIIYGQGTVGGAVFLPFYLCDWYMYGDVDDLLSLFDFPLQQFTVSRSERIRQVEEFKTCCNVLEYHSKLAPEMILTRNYVTKHENAEVPNTVERSWDFVRANLVCVSHQDVQLHWPKYLGLELQNNIDWSYSPDDGPGKFLTYNWTFQNWLCLYLGSLQYSRGFEDLPLLPATII